MRGPATLAYLDARRFRAHQHSDVVAALQPERDSVRRLLAECTAEDVGESGIEDVTSPVFAVLQGGTAGRIVAVAGYGDWPGQAAHLSVLTAPSARRRGFARVAASAAVTHAIDRRKLPQWRARPESSRRVARALGFDELGSQLSIRLG